jgi:ribosomal protein S18 acetylase RimI-like enzyme
MQIRALGSGDRERIQSILNAVGNFNAIEIKIALELVDIAISNPQCSDYLIFVLEDGQRVVKGYVCFGPTPLTDYTYDFYWMAVDPQCQGRGYGRELIGFVEQAVRERGGKILVLETSSMDSYQRTVRIYRQRGYEQVAQIKDFYRPGDDKVIFIKRF